MNAHCQFVFSCVNPRLGYDMLTKRWEIDTYRFLGSPEYVVLCDCFQIGRILIEGFGEPHLRTQGMEVGHAVLNRCSCYDPSALCAYLQGTFVACRTRVTQMMPFVEYDSAPFYVLEDRWRGEAYGALARNVLGNLSVGGEYYRSLFDIFFGVVLSGGSVVDERCVSKPYFDDVMPLRQ